MAKQGDLNAMDALNRAGLSGSADLARANPQAYGQSFQNALKGGASYDQALIRATSDSTMRIVGNQVPMGTLLYNIGGDPNKAVSAIGGALNRAGISMTPGELNLLGIVAAEASACQQDPSFQRKVALEMLKENSQEKAWTAASEKLWQEATNRVIAHGVADLDLEGKGEQHQQTANAIDGMTPLNGNSPIGTEETNQFVTNEQESISEMSDQQEAIKTDETDAEGWKRYQGQLVEAIDTRADEQNSVELSETQNNTSSESNSAKPGDTLLLKNAVGHEIIKVAKTDITGDPGSITQYTCSKGGIDRNYYGDDGKQYKQVSNHDHGHVYESTLGEHGEHAHDYSYENGKPIRGKARELSPLEREENKDFL